MVGTPVPLLPSPAVAPLISHSLGSSASNTVLQEYLGSLDRKSRLFQESCHRRAARRGSQPQRRNGSLIRPSGSGGGGGCLHRIGGRRRAAWRTPGVAPPAPPRGLHPGCCRAAWAGGGPTAPPRGLQSWGSSWPAGPLPSPWPPLGCVCVCMCMCLIFLLRNRFLPLLWVQKGCCSVRPRGNAALHFGIDFLTISAEGVHWHNTAISHSQI